eukprot:TRINITY_DN1207_c0_g1_i4.p1 TRINITY_DN1207_c0_g1~~TRINITY_DN1207_c0_g1_i4.p1  ORF type:complete len:463 (+),score=87.60 TRINITY_DN1207_c0_g1_i4:272-1660(+)
MEALYYQYYPYSKVAVITLFILVVHKLFSIVVNRTVAHIVPQKERRKFSYSLWIIVQKGFFVLFWLYIVFTELSHESWWKFFSGVLCVWRDGADHGTLDGSQAWIHSLLVRPLTLSPLFDLFYLVQLASYLEKLIIHLPQFEDKEYVQYTVHHVFTILLIYGSYALGFTRIGFIIMILHDINDVPLQIAKVFNYKYGEKSRMRNVMFYVFALSYLITRLVVFPTIVYSTYHLTGLVPYMQYLWAFKLVILVLNVIWMLAIIKVALKTEGKKKKANHAYTYEEICKMRSEKLETVFNNGKMPNINSLADRQFDGYNTLFITDILRFRKFIKGFYGVTDKDALINGRNVRAIKGYNIWVKQDFGPSDLKGKWVGLIKNGEPFRHGFYLVYDEKLTNSDNFSRWPNSLLLDYGRGGNPWFEPSKFLRDYLTQVGDGLYLGKAYVDLFGLRIFVSYFVLRERKAAK